MSSTGREPDGARIDRLRGALIGLAVGDALGAAVEFAPPGTFPPVVGYRGGGPHGLGPGEWTDDTSMALALAGSIAGAGWDLNDQARRYLAWYERGEYSVNGRCFDIGIQTRQALRAFQQRGEARACGNPDERCSGNGSLMRLAPVVLAYGAGFPENLPLLAERAEESSLPTHPSPICRSACRYLALLLAALAHGLPREEVLAPSWPLLKQLGPLHPAVATVAAGSFREKEPPAIQGSGYVVASLEAALWAFHQAPDFSQAVLRAVNLGQDADTTGAVCGQLAGACWGETGIPPEWRGGLARRELLETALAGLGLGREAAVKGSPRAAAADRVPRPAAAAPDWSYWVVPGRFLAGCYPGAQQPSERDAKLRALLDAGIRGFVNLMEPDERGHRDEPFEDYVPHLEALAGGGPPVRALRLPIRDLHAPTVDEMEAALDRIDDLLRERSIYLHCWGGVGRTGTVAACWLLRHGHATGENVLSKLERLRRMDRHRGDRRSPETPVQLEFVKAWSRRLPKR